MSSNAVRQEAPAPKEELLTVDDLFERYRGLVPKRTVDYWRYTKKGPPFIIVTSIPYAVNKSTLVSKFGELVRERKLLRWVRGP